MLFKHDCEVIGCCVYCGSTSTFDVYFSGLDPDRATVILRDGSNGPDYRAVDLETAQALRATRPDYDAALALVAWSMKTQR